MNNFFGATAQTNNFELGGGSFEPIPDGTKAKAAIDEAKWDSYNEETYISLRWAILEGEFKGRKVYQKVRISDASPQKAENAMAMLVAIDANAGGAIYAAGVKPDDMSLSINLMNKPMIIRLATWEINDKKGNWVNAVSSASPQGLAPPQQQQAPAMSQNFDNSVPF